MITSHQHCATLFTGCPCLSALCSKLRCWHTTVSMADHQCTSVTSVHRSSLFPFVLGFALLTMMTWLYHVLGPRVMVRTISVSRQPRFGTSYHLISRTVVLVANSSSRALRLGSFCKPTHKRCLWELCFKRCFTNTRFDLILTPKCYFLLLRPPKGTSLASNKRFEPSRVARLGRWEKNTKKYT